MIQITAITYAGERFVLSPAEDKYAIRKVSGLSPQGGTIVTQKMAQHGTTFVASTTDERNIVIDFSVVGDVEANRDALYAALPPSLPVTLEFITPAKTATITGYVEINEVNFFEMIASGQLSIICPDPFFRAEEAVYDASLGEAAIYSSCPFESGYRVSVAFTEDAESFVLGHDASGKNLYINYAFVAGDTLEIDTQERTVYINGANGFKYKTGDWPLLQAGDNLLFMTAGGTITFTDRYIGL